MTHRGRPRKDVGDRRVLAVRLPIDLYKRVHHRAVDDECGVQDVVTAALTAYLKRRGK